jgi:hypothetical protein
MQFWQLGDLEESFTLAITSMDSAKEYGSLEDQLRAKKWIEEVQKWLPEHVACWLENIGLAMHRTAFLRQQVGGSELCTLDIFRMHDLGIMDVSHQKLLQSKIKRFRKALLRSAVYDGIGHDRMKALMEDGMVVSSRENMSQQVMQGMSQEDTIKKASSPKKKKKSADRASRPEFRVDSHLAAISQRSSAPKNAQKHQHQGTMPQHNKTAPKNRQFKSPPRLKRRNDPSSTLASAKAKNSPSKRSSDSHLSEESISNPPAATSMVGVEVPSYWQQMMRRTAMQKPEWQASPRRPKPAVSFLDTLHSDITDSDAMSSLDSSAFSAEQSPIAPQGDAASSEDGYDDDDGEDDAFKAYQHMGGRRKSVAYDLVKRASQKREAETDKDMSQLLDNLNERKKLFSNGFKKIRLLEQIEQLRSSMPAAEENYWARKWKKACIAILEFLGTDLDLTFEDDFVKEEAEGIDTEASLKKSPTEEEEEEEKATLPQGAAEEETHTPANGNHPPITTGALGEDSVEHYDSFDDSVESVNDRFLADTAIDKAANEVAQQEASSSTNHVDREEETMHDTDLGDNDLDGKIEPKNDNETSGVTQDDLRREVDNAAAIDQTHSDPAALANTNVANVTTAESDSEDLSFDDSD